MSIVDILEELDQDEVSNDISGDDLRTNNSNTNTTSSAQYRMESSLQFCKKMARSDDKDMQCIIESCCPL